MVAKSYTHREGIDYNEVFSLIIKHSSIHILLALVAKYVLELDQLGVMTVFLNGDLDEGILMTQLVRFKAAGEKNLFCKLKSHYIG